MTDYPYQPLDFPGILAHGWQLTLRTIASAGVIALAVLLPLGMAVDHFGHAFYLGMASFIDKHGIPDIGTGSESLMRDFAPMIGTTFAFYSLMVVYVFSIIYVQTIITTLSWESVGGHRPSLAEGLRGSFSRRFWHNILQSLLLGIFALMAFLAQGIFRQFGSVIAPIFEAMVMVVVFGVAAWFTVATAFRVHEIVVDGRGPWHGLIASMALVRRNWWRVAGAILLIAGLTILLAGILPGLATHEGILGGFTSSKAPSMQEEDAVVLAAALRQFAGNFTLLSSLLQRMMISLLLLFGINLLTAVYVDLRVRRGDFEEEGSGEGG